jgi:ABC-type Fe3+-hydroxamate transport system substrate-binding protein
VKQSLSLTVGAASAARVASMRVVSLVPSVTETLLAWGVRPVAVTRFCEQPELPTVGGTKNPDIEAIVRLEPDLVVMCVEENRAQDADALRAAGIELVVLDVRSVADVEPQLDLLAARVGVEQRPLDQPIPVTTKPHLHDIAHGDQHGTHDPDVRGELRTPDALLRAFVPIWRRPWITLNADTYGSSVLEHCGVANIFADAIERYPTVSEAEVEARAPSLVVAPSEPYPFGERHRQMLERFGPVVFVDGKDLFWWGVRTPGAIRRLRNVLARARFRQEAR